MNAAAHIRLGVLTFQALPYRELRDDVQFAERIGLEGAWLADQAVPEELPVLEAWTSLAALAADTERIRLGTLVTNVAMRNPMILARQILTVDAVAGGRVDVGVGTGGYAEDHRWVGIDYLDAPGRVERLREVAEILDRALRGERVTYSGTYARLDDAPSLPPSQAPRAPIWIAVFGPRSMRLAARLAEGAALVAEDGVEADRAFERFAEQMKRLDAICVEQGRAPASLRRCYLAGIAREAIFASPASGVDFVGRFAAAGATDLVFALANPAQPAFNAAVERGQLASRENLERLVNDVSLPNRA